MANHYKAGTWNITCHVCGGKFKSDEVVKRWDDAIVCKDDWEPRHSLDFLRTPKESPQVPYISPQLEVVFVPLLCPYPTSAGQANVGTADCARAGEIINIIPINTSLIAAIAELAIADLAFASHGPLL